MAKEDLKKFQELLMTDADFREKLRKAIESYTGEADDKAVFENILIPLGQEYGISATYEEFKEYADAIVGKTEGELSEDELEMVAGGKTGSGLCFIIGGSNGAEAIAAIDDYDAEAHACFYLGVGIGVSADLI